MDHPVIVIEELGTVLPVIIQKLRIYGEDIICIVLG